MFCVDHCGHIMWLDRIGTLEQVDTKNSTATPVMLHITSQVLDKMNITTKNENSLMPPSVFLVNDKKGAINHRFIENVAERVLETSGGIVDRDLVQLR